MVCKVGFGLLGYSLIKEGQVNQHGPRSAGAYLEMEGGVGGCVQGGRGVGIGQGLCYDHILVGRWMRYTYSLVAIGSMV